ncbi:MAG: phage tail protein [Lachnospiraceae bacterium]|nr:phage tail protein [Lachnospiraceae bacterium]
MTNLYDSEIKEILPEFLSKKPEVRAVSHAISKALQRLLDYSKGMEVYSGVDSLSAEVLDMMAIELDALYYDMSLPIEAKRRIIKETLPQYLTAGTVGAVENLITTIFGGGEVEEWYQYSGTPGYFRLYVDISDSVNNPVYDIDAVSMEKKLERVKKYSQHLDSFAYMIKHSIEIKKKIEAWTSTGPECGTILCGQYWMPSALGYTDNNGINIGARPELFMSDQPEAGTLPDISTMGYSLNPTENVQAQVNAYNGDTLECSEDEEAGTQPLLATVGYSGNNGIQLWNSKAKAYNTNHGLCGVTICGDD